MCSRLTPRPTSLAGNSSQDRESVEQPKDNGTLSARLAEHQRRQNASCTAFCAAWMTRVGNSRRSWTSSQQRIDVLAARERSGEDVGGRDGVLDREIDADPADRRHRMGRIADRQQAGPPPARQPVERDREQLHLIPVL